MIDGVLFGDRDARVAHFDDASKKRFAARRFRDYSTRRRFRRKYQRQTGFVSSLNQRLRDVFLERVRFRNDVEEVVDKE